MNVSSKKSELHAAVWASRPLYVRAVWYSIGANLLTLMSVVYMLEVYTRVVDSASFKTLAMLTLLVIGLYVVMALFEWVRTELQQQAGRNFDERVRARIFDSIFLANLRNAGNFGSQALNDLKVLREFFYSPAVFGLMESPVALLLLIVLFLISPLLGWVALFGALLQVGIAVLTEKRTQPPLAKANQLASASRSYANNSLRNAEVMESMGMLDGVERQWMQRQEKFLVLQAEASDHAGGLSALSKSLQLIQTSAMLGLGAWLMLQGDLAGGAGMMLVGSILGGKIMQPLVQIVSNWKLVINARDSYRRLDQLLEKIPKVEEQMSLPAPKGRLSVEAVTASAPGSTLPILRNVSFAVAAGECLAVVGPSGSGKTTLARMLMGLWPSLSGKIRLDGVDVFAWSKAELGPHVGYLPQGVELFRGTIAENVARFGEVDRDAVLEAIHLIGLDSLIDQLPDGIDTEIGEDGLFLSGGQRQRIGLARAIYRSPKFVVLDEPNSSLDEKGDAALLAMLEYLKQHGTTVVVITHRTNVLAVADRMLVLREGMVQAFGARDEVLAALKKAASPQAQPSPAKAEKKPALVTTVPVTGV